MPFKGEVLYKFLHAISQVDLPLLDKLQNGDRSILLCNGTEPEDHVGLHGDIQFDIGCTECLIINYFAFFGDQHGGSWCNAFEPGSDQAVELGWQVCVGRCLPGCDTAGKCCQ